MIWTLGVFEEPWSGYQDHHQDRIILSSGNITLSDGKVIQLNQDSVIVPLSELVPDLESHHWHYNEHQYQDGFGGRKVESLQN